MFKIEPEAFWNWLDLDVVGVTCPHGIPAGQCDRHRDTFQDVFPDVPGQGLTVAEVITAVQVAVTVVKMARVVFLLRHGWRFTLNVGVTPLVPVLFPDPETTPGTPVQPPSRPPK